MYSLTTAPPRVAVKRDHYRAPRGLGYKYQSVSIPLRPAVALHHGNGSLSHAQKTRPERGHIPVLSSIALVEDQRGCSQTTILSTRRHDLR